jgi:outer membrane protein assembly factor BamB
VRYKKRLATIPLPQYCHPFNSYASPSPVVEKDRLYVSFGSPYNACLDTKTGNVLWQRDDFVCNHFRGPGSSPFLYKDLLILHFDGSDQQYVVGLNKDTGETVWRTDRTVDYNDLDPETGKIQRQGDWRKAFSTPIIAEVQGQDILISLGSMAIYGYDPTNGNELWRVDCAESHSGACRPVYAHGLVYAPTGAGAELWAIKPDGRGVVTNSHVAWKHKRTAVPRRSSILVLGDLIFMVSDSGVAACIDAQRGKLLWKKRLGGSFSASLVHADERIYFFDQEGQATVIKASREYEVLAKNELDEGLMASPAISGDALYLRTRTHLYRIEEP